jgi:prepilin-type N-terminal cleavage/methylation domain-containing protein
MKLHRQTNSAAFTILELLVVIAIIALIAGLVVGLNNIASEKKKISRAQVERDWLVTLIDAYRQKTGVYPPSNPSDAGKNTLVYELAGATNNNANFETRFGNIKSSDLMTEFGIAGVVNCFRPSVDDITEFRRFLKQLKPEQFTITGPNNVLRLVFPADGPNGRPNFWKYASGTNAVHNPDSFDLWVEIVLRNKTNIIGNWKD